MATFGRQQLIRFSAALEGTQAYTLAQANVAGIVLPVDMGMAEVVPAYGNMRTNHSTGQFVPRNNENAISEKSGTWKAGGALGFGGLNLFNYLMFPNVSGGPGGPMTYLPPLPGSALANTDPTATIMVESNARVFYGIGSSISDLSISADCRNYVRWSASGICQFFTMGQPGDIVPTGPFYPTGREERPYIRYQDMTTPYQIGVNGVAQAVQTLQSASINFKSTPTRIPELGTDVSKLTLRNDITVSGTISRLLRSTDTVDYHDTEVNEYSSAITLTFGFPSTPLMYQVNLAAAKITKWAPTWKGGLQYEDATFEAGLAWNDSGATGISIVAWNARPNNSF